MHTATDWAILISASTLSITAIIGSFFAGLIALKQLPRISKQTNGIITTQTGQIDDLHNKVVTLYENALEISRMAPPRPLPDEPKESP